MTVYAEGTSVDTSGLGVVAPKEVTAGSEYIWEYWTPAVTFSFISAEQLSGFIKGLLNLDSYINENVQLRGMTKPPVKITGIMIDTATGNIWVRGTVQPVPTQGDVAQAGVNPWAVAALIGGLFAVIGAAISLRYVYEVFYNPYEPGAIDPCTQSDVISYVKCLAKETRWFLAGVVIGVIALTAYLLIKFGPKLGLE